MLTIEYFRHLQAFNNAKIPEYVDHVKTLGENALACNNPMNF